MSRVTGSLSHRKDRCADEVRRADEPLTRDTNSLRIALGSLPCNARATAAGALALALALGAAACGDDAAVGGPDRIVVGAAPPVWEQLSDRLHEVLEPTYFPLPDEQAFELVPADPTAEPWEEERRARQVLLIGTPDDPWIADAWERGVGPSPPVPSLTKLTDLWAKGQRVLMLLLPPEGVDAALEETIADVRVTFDRWYREYVVERMYFPAGPDGALADSLQVAAGFDLLVPRDYEWTRAGDAFLFQPPDTDTTALRRRIAVTWQSPIPAATRGAATAMLAWRERLSTERYGIRQRVEPAGVHGGATTHRGNFALHLVGTWRADGASGPFLLRGVMCPTQDRMYLLDGWLYAPGERGQEYMVQLESILNSFRCGSANR